VSAGLLTHQAGDLHLDRSVVPFVARPLSRVGAHEIEDEAASPSDAQSAFVGLAP
jgi:hypothetical protein